MSVGAFITIAGPLLAAVLPALGKLFVAWLEGRTSPHAREERARQSGEQELVRQIAKRDDAAMSASLEEDLRSLRRKANSGRQEAGGNE